jgi:hypothetical protein
MVLNVLLDVPLTPPRRIQEISTHREISEMLEEPPTKLSLLLLSEWG